MKGKSLSNFMGEIASLLGQEPLPPIRETLIEPGLGNFATGLVSSLDIGKKFLAVADAAASEAFGHKFPHALTLEAGAKPSLETAGKIADAAKDFDFLVAVGSGSMNDLVKFASFSLGKPYAVFATAPSMNGYASGNSSLIENGGKKTFPARPPIAIYMDLEVLAKAPQRLIRSGAGDLSCRGTAQADWLLSHLLTGSFYSETPYKLLASREAAFFALDAGLPKGDTEQIKLLAETLILSGIGMYIAGGSYPASQGEHALAHYMEAEDGAAPLSYHGEQIAVTTIAMSRIQQEILVAGGEGISFKNRPGFSPPSAPDWPEIFRRIAPVTIPPEKIEALLRRLSLPVLPADLGWNRDIFRAALESARLGRERIGFLDLETGV